MKNVKQGFVMVLGINIANNLAWSNHIDAMVKRAHKGGPVAAVKFNLL